MRFFCLLLVSLSGIQAEVSLLKTRLQVQPEFFTAEPDAANHNIKITEGHLSARLGQSLALVSSKQQEHWWAILAEPFVELHNFQTGEAVPWQLWRAQFSLGALLGRGPLSLELSYVHESDHATDVAFITKHSNLKPEFFDNRSLRSFEYFKVAPAFTSQSSWLLWQIRPVGRIYTIPLNSSASRNLKWALGSEARAGYKVNNGFVLWLGGYYELIQTDYISKQNDYATPLPGDLWYRTVFLAASWQSNSRIELSLGYTDSNGRGLDFLQRYRGLQIKLSLVL